MTTHSLKSYPLYYSLLRAGFKTAEVRINDRNYLSGDTLVISEWSPEMKKFTNTNEELVVKISLVSPLKELLQLTQPIVLLSFDGKVQVVKPKCIS